PSRENTTLWPSGASAGPAPEPSRHAALPLVYAAQIARSGPRGSLLGLAIQPVRFGSLPRTNVTIDPSSEISSSERMIPTAAPNLVRRTGLKSGAAAV